MKFSTYVIFFLLFGVLPYQYIVMGTGLMPVWKGVLMLPTLAALGKGESVIIFPEGKRIKSGKGLQPFHNGAALLAARSGARVVPVYNAFWHFPHRYRLAIGDPVQLDPIPAEGASAEWLKTQTARMQEAVAALAFESDK